MSLMFLYNMHRKQEAGEEMAVYTLAATTYTKKMKLLVYGCSTTIRMNL